MMKYFVLALTLITTATALDSTVLTRAQHSFTELAAHAETIPSLAYSDRTAAVEQLHQLQQLLATVIASRTHLAAAQRTLVDQYVSFFATLTPERLATMHRLEAEALQQKLATLYNTLQPSQHTARSSSLPIDLHEHLLTLTLHTQRLLAPHHYRPATAWQRIKHTARNLTTPGSTARRALGPAIFLSVVVLGTGVVIKKSRQKPQETADTVTLSHCEALFNSATPLHTSVTQLQTALQTMLSMAPHPKDKHPKNYRKWYTSSSRLSSAPCPPADTSK